MAPKILIYLLRRDLRLSDNPVFHDIAEAAANKSGLDFTHLLPLYVFHSTQIEISGFRAKSAEDNGWPFPEARSRVGGFWRCGPHRAKFLAESVWDLKQSLQNIGSDLCIRAGQPSEMVKEVFEHLENFKSQGGPPEIVAVWMMGDETSEEKSDETKIRSVVEKYGKEFRIFKDEKYFIDE
jgi:deoxyribodipyrimidine photo-lyase